MKKQIIEIEGLGYPQSIILRYDPDTSESIDTEDLIDELNELLSSHKWIKVTEKLPELEKDVLWYMEDGSMFIDCLSEGMEWEEFEDMWGVMYDYVDEEEFKPVAKLYITHWTELPKPSIF